MKPEEFVHAQPAAWKAIVTQMVEQPLFCAINKGSVNGPGSSLKYTEGLREELPRLLKKYGVATMLDAPCGDLTWIRRIDLSFLYSYIGMDVEPRIIQTLQTEFRADNHNMAWQCRPVFICANLLTRKAFPKVDLILCRDFLAHLTTDYISHMLQKFAASGSTYLLASNYPGESNDFDYHPDEYPWRGYLERPHDLTAAPFNLTQVDAIPEMPAPGGILTHDHELGLFTLQPAD